MNKLFPVFFPAKLEIIMEVDCPIFWGANFSFGRYA